MGTTVETEYESSGGILHTSTLARHKVNHIHHRSHRQSLDIFIFAFLFDADILREIGGKAKTYLLEYVVAR